MASFAAARAAATDDHDVGIRTRQDWLQAAHCLGGLGQWRARADAKIVVGLWYGEIGEERAGHRGVVVLARVNEYR